MFFSMYREKRRRKKLSKISYNSHKSLNFFLLTFKKEKERKKSHSNSLVEMKDKL